MIASTDKTILLAVGPVLVDYSVRYNPAIVRPPDEPADSSPILAILASLGTNTYL